MDCSRNSGRAAWKGLPVADARFWGLDVHATRHVRFFPPSLLRAQLRTKVDAYYNRWPTPSSIPVVEYQKFEDTLPPGHFHRLPLEILLDIVADCPVSSVVSLSTT